MDFIPLAQPLLGEEEAKAVYDTVKSGWISMGKKVAEFEEQFASYVQAPHALAVNNGTSALHLALAVHDIEDGAEVLIPDITFISTPNVVLYERLNPVIVECDPLTYNIDMDDMKRKLSSRTRAIIPVDMNGLPVDFEAVIAFSEENNLFLIADSAESLGAEYKGRKVGAQAPLHIFSFFPNKNITTGEGGMITTTDPQLYEKIKRLRNQGQDYRYHHVDLGYNYRMNNVSASIGIEQMKKIDRVVERKNRIVERYNQAFQTAENFTLPVIPEYVTQHSWYMYTISLKKGIDRDEVVKQLHDRGIETRLSFPPVHIQPYYMERFGYKPDDYPVSLDAWQRLINLPIGPDMSEAQQDRVIDVVLELCK